ncbi:uncharacterized protein LOC128549105 [Mercenaria mercenaria]|uniref:uncharacterized protein LOC128549105 n=1 Tax=Mercenaria mercenaria TaxID=6596 RepID=UPI00234F0744|nr:uncharacterized protein LOC128549105 [Mercenaria mercenaria]
MMSTERLKILHRQEQNQRKFVCVMNDVAKTQQDLYEGYIEKEKHESAQKSDKAIVVTKRNIVRQKVLKKCMKSKREEVERQNAKKIYGQYHGVPVEQIASQIDTFLEKNHPKIRRRRKIDELFQEGYNKGAILDSDTIHNKVQDYFERPLVEIQHKESSEVKDEIKTANSTFPALSKSFYTGNFKMSSHPPAKETANTDSDKKTKDHSEEKIFVKRKVSKFLNDDVPDDVSVQSETPVNNLIMHNRGIRPLTLPPIKIGTDSEVPHRPSKQKPDCIAELIARIHKAKDTREKEIKIKKERRAKRLQHERVFGIGSAVTDDSNDTADHSDGIFSDWDSNPWKKDRKDLINEKTKEKENRMNGKGLKLPPLNVSK